MSWQRRPIRVIVAEIIRTYGILFYEALPLAHPELPRNVIDYRDGLEYAASLLILSLTRLGDGPLFRDDVRNVFSSIRKTTSTALGWSDRPRWFQEGFEKMIDQAQKAVLGE